MRTITGHIEQKGITMPNSITAADYPARPMVSSENVCFGYMIQDRETEVLFARQDGRMFRSEVVARPNIHFDKPHRKWAEVVEIPGHAEFIGYYPKIKSHD